MLSKLQKIRDQKTSEQKGFTIIEVMIVLAIAGLIILIVFLAVPALQRNGRNTQRKNDVGQISAAIATYVTDNSKTSTLTTGDVTAALANAKLGFYSPTVGSATTGIWFGTPGTAPAAGTTASATVVSSDTVIVVTGVTCASGVPTATGASARSIAVVYANETAGAPTIGCVSN